MRAWRSELAVALAAALATAAWLQYESWRDLAAVERAVGVADLRLGDLAPIVPGVRGYRAAATAIEVRTQVLQEVEPARWRLWGGPPPGANEIPARRPGLPGRCGDGSVPVPPAACPEPAPAPAWAERLAVLTRELSRGPAPGSVRIRAGRLEITVDRSRAAALEAAGRRLRARGLITAFDFEPAAAAGTAALHADLDAAFAAPGRGR